MCVCVCESVLCAACRLGHEGSGFFCVDLLIHLLAYLLLPVQLSFFFISRLVVPLPLLQPSAVSDTFLSPSQCDVIRLGRDWPTLR